MCVGGPALQAAKVASQAENGPDAPPAFADPPSLLNERPLVARAKNPRVRCYLALPRRPCRHRLCRPTDEPCRR